MASVRSISAVTSVLVIQLAAVEQPTQMAQLTADAQLVNVVPNVVVMCAVVVDVGGWLAV